MNPPDLGRLPLGAFAIGAVLAGAVFAALSLTARAPDQSARQADRARILAELKGLPDPSRPGPYPARAVCRLGLEPAATVLKARVSNAASASGVAIGELTMTGSPAEEGRRLSAVRLSLTGEGSYLSEVAFLRILSEADPAVFVDHLHISRLAGGRASLTLEGRIYCSIREAP